MGSPHYHNYNSEVFYLSQEDEKTLYYTYITYNKDKLRGLPKGFGQFDFNIFRLKAWAEIPVSKCEILRLRIYLLKNNDVEDFTVQYEAAIDPLHRKHIRLPLKNGYTSEDVHKLVIRSDYGHPNKKKHTNVELWDINMKNKIHTSFLEQTYDLPNYERAIHYVLMQAEKYNPLIGAYYWISPFGIHGDRVLKLYNKWSEAKPSTPLCILSRNVNILTMQAIHNTSNNNISDNEFEQIVNDEIQECKEIEKSGPDGVRQLQLEPLSDTVWYPFPLYKPDEDAIHEVFKIEKLSEKRQFALSFEKTINDEITSRVNGI